MKNITCKNNVIHCYEHIEICITYAVICIMFKNIQEDK
jgi:hypothetical protein